MLSVYKIYTFTFSRRFYPKRLTIRKCYKINYPQKKIQISCSKYSDIPYIYVITAALLRQQSQAENLQKYHIYLSSDKSTHNKSLWIEVSLKFPKCKCNLLEFIFLIISNNMGSKKTTAVARATIMSLQMHSVYCRGQTKIEPILPQCKGPYRVSLLGSSNTYSIVCDT